MKEIYCIHDRTFKSAMSNMEVAKDFFNHYLPKTLQSLIDYNSLPLKLRSDVLYEVNIAHCPCYIYFLCEHQSSVDPLMPFRLWVYMIRIWEDHLKNNDKAKQLPLIFPMVFYHEKALYTGERTLKNIIKGPKEIIDAVLFQDFHLIDMHHYPDEDLKRQHWAGVLAYNIMMLNTFFQR